MRQDSTSQGSNYLLKLVFANLYCIVSIWVIVTGGKQQPIE